MRQKPRSTVIGVFSTREEAQEALFELRRAGFRDEQLGVLARDAETRHSFTPPEATNAGVGAATGAAAGAGIGGAWGLGIAAGLLPAVGPVIAGGTVAAVLASVLAGATAGGIVGGLIGLGVPEEEARYYQGEVEAGRILITVRAEGREEQAATIIRGCGGTTAPDMATHAL